MGKFARWSAPEGLSLLAAWDARGLLRRGDRPPLRRAGGGAAGLGAALPRRGGGAAHDRRDGRRAGGKRAVAPRAGLPLYRGHGEENGSGVKRRETHKYEPPNLTAIKFWLACRLPEKWGTRLGEAETKNGLDALLAALDAQAGRGGSSLKDRKEEGMRLSPKQKRYWNEANCRWERQVRGHALGQDVSGLLRHPPPPACAGGQAGAGGAPGQHARHLGAQRCSRPCATSTARRWSRPCAPTARPRSLASESTVWRGQQAACRPPARFVHQVLLRRRGRLLGARGVRDAQKPPRQGVFCFDGTCNPPGRDTGSSSSSTRARTSFPSSTASTTTPFCRRACARR